MTEQEWDERDYNQQRGKCFPIALAMIAPILVAITALVMGRRR